MGHMGGVHGGSVCTRQASRSSTIVAASGGPASAEKRAVEMAGLWKAWKAKSRLPTLSTSPLEISPKGGEISTFPQLR
jgi:hypothetical protein